MTSFAWPVWDEGLLYGEVEYSYALPWVGVDQRQVESLATVSGADRNWEPVSGPRRVASPVGNWLQRWLTVKRPLTTAYGGAPFQS